MIRKYIALAAFAILIPGIARALGLGPLETFSALNEPFNARIELVGMTANDFDTLKVEIASADQFQRAGIVITSDLLRLKFDVVETPTGSDYIAITTRDAVREPFLNFLLELNWANGRMIREYTVLLDPPAQMTRQTTAPAPAPRVTDINEAVPRTSSGQGGGLQGSEYSVQRGDTLWTIASRTLPDGITSVEQMMIALQQANPDAFIDSNINALRAGVVLHIPDYDDVNRMSRGEALAEVRRQQDAWLGTRQSDAAAPASRSLGGADGSSTAAATSAADDARLRIVAPTDAAATAVASSAIAEQLSATAQENEELRARMVEAEEIIDLLQRQVDIKNDELAVLQQRLAELGIEHGDAVATDDTEATTEEPVEEEAPIVDEPVAELPAEVADEEPAPPVVLPTPADEPGMFGKIVAMVPGGLPVLIGIIAALGLVVVAFVVKATRDRDSRMPDMPAPVARAAVVAETTAAPVTTSQFDQVATSARPGPAVDLTSTIESLEPLGDGETPQEMLQTLDGTGDLATMMANEQGMDPLEEVNVYLAYERFDQAEELVRNAIAANPREHKYKLRLLEVFYSANDKRKYEVAAKELHDAVGDNDPLWQSAVAMWQEMSPTRALFEERTDFLATMTTPVKAFVDITADTPDRTEQTAVGFASDFSEDRDVFDAGATQGDGADFVDLTATTEEKGVLDLTATGADASAADTGEVLDITTGKKDRGGEDLFDISGGGPNSPTDLLDVTRGGNVSPEGHGDLLNVTAPGSTLSRDEEVLDITSGQFGDTQDSIDGKSHGNVVEFDISDTVAPVFETDDADDEDVVSVEAAPLGEGAGGDDAALDFDIGKLSMDDGDESLGFDDDFDLSLETTGDMDQMAADVKSAAESVELELTVDEAARAAAAGGPLDLTLDGDETGIDTPDLTLQGSELDRIVDQAQATMNELQSELPVEDDDEAGFDLSLEDTSELSELSIDETLELPRADDTDLSAFDAETSLEDLTKSMEDTVAGLGDAGALDLDVSMDIGDALDDTHNPHADSTLIMPADPDIEVQSDVDETDTKLNLAKAYIELGDRDGARSILDEVIRDGTPSQRDEARGLRAQLS